MAKVIPREGRLIVVEGCHGRDLEAVAQSLFHHYSRERKSTISSWDASGIFYQMLLDQYQEQNPSARTLMLLYAADLSYRLRYQIQPALQAGECVVAAPYIMSAIGLGAAIGLPLRWMDTLFRFAPPAALTYRMPESKELPKRMKPSEGYSEFCCLALQQSPHLRNPKELQRKFVAYMTEQQERGAVRPLPKRFLPHIDQQS